MTNEDFANLEKRVTAIEKHLAAGIPAVNLVKNVVPYSPEDVVIYTHVLPRDLEPAALVSADCQSDGITPLLDRNGNPVKLEGPIPKGYYGPTVGYGIQQPDGSMKHYDPEGKERSADELPVKLVSAHSFKVGDWVMKKGETQQMKVLGFGGAGQVVECTWDEMVPSEQTLEGMHIQPTLNRYTKTFAITDLEPAPLLL
jgi:hypothetical protein